MLFILIFASGLAALGQVLFKLGAVDRVGLAIFLNIWITTGLFAYGASTLLWIYSLSKIPLVKVYPFTALTFILTILCGILFFNETVGTRYWTGMLLVLLGLLLISI